MVEIVEMEKVRLPMINFELIFENGGWGMVYNGKFTPFDKSENCTFLMPILEYQYFDIVAIFKQQILEKEWSTIDFFPFYFVIFCALDSLKNYWIDCALKWIIQTDKFKIGANERLLKIYESVKLEQKLKHKLKKVINNLGAKIT